MNGLTLVYEAPEASGEHIVHFQAFDPNGNKIEPPTTAGQSFNTTITVKSARNLVPVSIPNLSLNVKSHPNNGHYATSETEVALRNAVKYFFDKVDQMNEAATIPSDVIVIPFIESQGISLNWGGLFDVATEVEKKWAPPHCAHRNGTNIDISMHIFERYSSSNRKKLKKFLQQSLLKSKFNFPVRHESPTDPLANHWHAVINIKE